MSHIFISYSKKDIEFARHLRQLLEDEGYGVWMDETKLVPAERWWRDQYRCAAFIVIMSPHSRSLVWVGEISGRINKLIFPVLLKGGWLAGGYSIWTYVGFTADLPPRLINGLRACAFR
jgi:hypothetical protein